MKKLIVLILFLTIIVYAKQTPPKKELRGVFISYTEEQRYFSEDKIKTKKNIRNMINNVKNSKMNLIILQVRSNSDAIYDSKYFPYSKVITGVEGEDYFDILAYFIKHCHKSNIKLYAWINPYRIRTTDEIETISKSNPAYPYLNTETIYRNNGVFFNPSKQIVEDLVVNGVEEIVQNYEVDGILFDDYFYPGEDIDNKDYEEYINTHEYITINNYRLNVINKMVKRVHEVCNKYSVPFGISPDGNISNNYENHHADVRRWMSEEGYIDFIMPQVYYGFFNETKPFYHTVKEWNSLIKTKSVKLMIALALYKSGNIDVYAKSGQDEWIKYNNILKREVIISRNLSNYTGFSIFRYDNLYQEEYYNDQLIEEVKNLTDILK